MADDQQQSDSFKHRTHKILKRIRRLQIKQCSNYLNDRLKPFPHGVCVGDNIKSECQEIKNIIKLDENKDRRHHNNINETDITNNINETDTTNKNYNKIITANCQRTPSVDTLKCLLSNVRNLEQSYDSDATESSSGGESCDELDNYSVGFSSQSMQQTPPSQNSIQNRAIWKWATDRCKIASTWTWLQAQITDLEYKIRQQNELMHQFRAEKSPIFAAPPPVPHVLPLCPPPSSAASLNTTCPANPPNTIIQNQSKPLASPVPSTSLMQTQAFLIPETCARMLPLINNFRQRRLVKAASVLNDAPRKTSVKYSNVPCSCSALPQSVSPCIACNGRYNCAKPVERDTIMPFMERVSLLDSCFHPVLSFSEDVSLGQRISVLLKKEMRSVVVKSRSGRKKKPNIESANISSLDENSFASSDYIGSSANNKGESDDVNIDDRDEKTRAVSVSKRGQNQARDKYGKWSKTNKSKSNNKLLMKLQSSSRPRKIDLNLNLDYDSTINDTLRDFDTTSSSTEEEDETGQMSRKKSHKSTSHPTYRRRNNKHDTPRKRKHSSSTEGAFSSALSGLGVNGSSHHHPSNDSTHGRSSKRPKRDRRCSTKSESSNCASPASPQSLSNSSLSFSLANSNSNQGISSAPVNRRRRSEQHAYDIDNIVIPFSIAATTRVEKLEYKEIITPSWRVCKNGTSLEDDGTAVDSGDIKTKLTENSCADSTLVENCNSSSPVNLSDTGTENVNLANGSTNNPQSTAPETNEHANISTTPPIGATMNGNAQSLIRATGSHVINRRLGRTSNGTIMNTASGDEIDSEQSNLSATRMTRSSSARELHRENSARAAAERVAVATLPENPAQNVTPEVSLTNEVVMKSENESDSVANTNGQNGTNGVSLNGSIGANVNPLNRANGNDPIVNGNYNVNLLHLQRQIPIINYKDDNDEEIEDLSDEAFAVRHQKCEIEEKKRFSLNLNLNHNNSNSNSNSNNNLLINSACLTQTHN